MGAHRVVERRVRGCCRSYTGAAGVGRFAPSAAPTRGLRGWFAAAAAPTGGAWAPGGC